MVNMIEKDAFALHLNNKIKNVILTDKYVENDQMKERKDEKT